MSNSMAVKSVLEIFKFCYSKKVQKVTADAAVLYFLFVRCRKASLCALEFI